jgi:SulP family sulfate permease
VEYVVVLVILAGIIARGFLPGVVLGLVMAVVLFAVSYGRIELVREVAFGETYHSNVDRPPAERAALRSMGEQVQVLRVNGFVFFGSANGLLEKIRRRVESGPIRFLLVDMRRVSGVDASAVVAFVKVVHLASSGGFELVFTGASDPVRAQLARGGVSATEGVVAFEPDLDRGLQRAEDALLAGAELAPASAAPSGGAGMPEGLRPHLERVELAQGTVLIHQGEPPTDLYVLESGRLSVEALTPEGTRMRLRTMHPGVVVGEVALYTGATRTADVVAETPAVVLRLSKEQMDRIAQMQPELASELHRWLAGTLAGRLDDTLHAFEALLE